MMNANKETSPSLLVEEWNELMKRLIPELDTDCATIPMKLGRWYQPKEHMDDDTPCFIQSAKDNGIYQDYIWMPTTTAIKKRGKETIEIGLPAGYYHLRTKESYLQICSRLEEVSPPSCWSSCCLPSNPNATTLTPSEKAAFKEIKLLMKLRKESDTPNDEYILRIHRLKNSSGMNRLVRGLQKIH